jgi:hypothetical protein
MRVWQRLLQRSTGIQHRVFDLSTNGLDDVESAKLLRELIRRNKTIKACVLQIIALVSMPALL